MVPAGLESKLQTEIPRVSIGLAVYNGEKYLEQAIQSILAQTFTDFELIISDNASTDRTAEICQKYAAQDPRIRYSRNLTNIGGANNENLTFRLSRGEYFRWAAHDDVLASTLLEKCVEVLDSDSQLILCYPMETVIDSDSNASRTVATNFGTSSSPFTRFVELSSRGHACEATYGLMRSETLKKTRLQQNYTDSDRTLLCELGLMGKFYEIPEYLFFKRCHSGNIYQDWRTRMVWFNPGNTGKIVFPFWQQYFDYFATIRRVKLSRLIKLKCYMYMLGPWLFTFGKNMIKDLLIAVMMVLHTSDWRRKRYESTSNW